MQWQSRPDLPERIARLETTQQHHREMIDCMWQKLQEATHQAAHSIPPASPQITDGTWWVLAKFAAAVVLMLAAAILAAAGQTDLAMKIGGAVKAMP